MKTIFFIFILFIGFESHSQCYFSESGDSVLVVNSYRVSWSSDEKTYGYKYSYDIFTNAGDGHTTKLVGTYNGEYGGRYEGSTHPGFQLHDSLLGNFKVKAEWSTNPELDTTAHLDLDIEKVRNLKCKMIWCSKGCSWNLYYKMTADLTFAFRNDTLWNERFDHLFFVNSTYIGWGEKPEIRNAKYFKENPYACMEFRPYWSEKFQKYFIYVLYATRKINHNRDRLYNKSTAFFIE